MDAAVDGVARNVRRLQPLRVLLAGRDRRFIRVTSFLLAQRGYEVAQTELRDTVAAAGRHRSDVVLLETDGSVASAARELAALQALPAAPGVLLVFQSGERERWAGIPGVEKWASVDALVGEIEAASRTRQPPSTEPESVRL
jgi:CheY-like chemotaxis protein